jgi:N-acetylneuraminate lyase
MSLRFTGVIAAPFTPMNSDGSLNLNMIELQAKALIANRVQGAFICGTTGEGVSLTTQERMRVAEKWREAATPELAIIVHVGHESLRESRTLAAHAEKIKVSAFAALAPSFFPVASVEVLVDYCAQIAEAAPSLPFFYYHIPTMTGVDLPMRHFLERAASRIPNLAGIKFTHENLMDYRRCLEFDGGRFDILFGRDEILLAALALGGAGAVGSTYNFMAPVYHRLMDAFRAADLEAARRFQSLAISIITVMSRHGGLPAGKAMMKLTGLDCGPVRPPLVNLSDDQFEMLKTELNKVGFPSNTSGIVEARL